MRGFLLAMMLMAAPVSAGEVSDILMKPGAMSDMAAGATLDYAHERKLDAPPATQQPTAADQGVIPLEELEDGGVQLERRSEPSGDLLSLSLLDSGQSHVVAEFPITSSNPILLFFLENVVRTISSQTNGSPFYIRNRIREALVAAKAGEQKPDYAEVVIQPFAQDKNAARLGDFVNLSITLRYDPAQPSQLLALLAQTETGGSGYRETMTLVGEN